MKGSEIVHLGGIIEGNAETLEGYLPLFNGMRDWLGETLGGGGGAKPGDKTITLVKDGKQRDVTESFSAR